MIKAEVSLLQLSAEVQYNSAVACTDDLVTAVDDCGFDCKLLSVHSIEEQAEHEQRPQVGLPAAAAAAGLSRLAG